MQLEEFRKKVDPNILKDLKMSKEEFDRFLRDYADLKEGDVLETYTTRQVERELA